MSEQCFNDIDQDCQACYEVTANDCTDITISGGLTPATVYWLWLIAPDGNYYKEQVTIAGDGSFTIDVGSSTYPSGLFNQYAGTFELFLSTSQTDPTPVSFSVSSTAYTCVVVTFTVACCDNI